MVGQHNILFCQNILKKLHLSIHCPQFFSKFDNILLTIHSKMFRVGTKTKVGSGNLKHIFLGALSYCSFWVSTVWFKGLSVCLVLQVCRDPINTVINGPGHAKMCLMTYANNKGADQPAHPRSLISTFFVRCLDSMICILAISKVSRF